MLIGMLGVCGLFCPFRPFMVSFLEHVDSFTYVLLAQGIINVKVATHNSVMSNSGCFICVFFDILFANVKNSLGYFQEKHFTKLVSYFTFSSQVFHKYMIIR